MNTLTFYKNPVSKIGTPIFSDLRLYDATKHIIGALFTVIYKGSIIGSVEIKTLVCFHFEGEKCINETTAWLSFGKPLQEVKKMLTQFYPHTQPGTVFTFLSLEWTHRNIELQEALLKDWWADQRSQHTPNPQASFNY